MKKIMLPFVMLLFVSFTTSDTKLTKAERKLAITELKDSQKQLLRIVKGLSEEQLNFKSSPESWSVANCVEHLVVVEEMAYGMLQELLKTSADPSRRSEVKVSDEELLMMMVNRTNKVKTPEPFEPSGKFTSFDVALKEFKTQREKYIRYVKTTDDDLRNRYQQLPFGTIDGFQIFLFVAAHSERHIKQIEEVLAATNFPGK